jgi:hypothetical protein
MLWCTSAKHEAMALLMKTAAKEEAVAILSPGKRRQLWFGLWRAEGKRGRSKLRVGG